MTPSDPDGRIAALRASELFGGLAAGAARALAERFRERSLAAGGVLFAEGDPADAMYLVVSGRLRVLARGDDGDARPVATVGPGSSVGEAALLLETRRSATVVAAEECRLLRLGAGDFQQALAGDASLRSVVAGLILRRLPRLRAVTTGLFGALDEGLADELEGELSWLRLHRGEYLFRQGDPGDAVYVVVHGRLEGVREQDGRVEIRAEIGRDEPVGEIALLTREPRSLSVRAARDSDLIRLTAAGFDKVLERRPQAMLSVVRTLARRLAPERATPRHRRPTAVAILGLSPGARIDAFLGSFSAGLAEAGRVAWVPREAFEAEHGRGAADVPEDHPRAPLLAEWMNRQEEDADFVVFVGDAGQAAWRRRCVAHADRVLVAAESADPDGPERLAALRLGDSGPPLELVLLHGRGAVLPSGTARWLSAAEVARHHHVREERPDDARRVARFVSGRAVGVVLSGGGARGFAHSGVLRALEERGVPIDFVAGVSMGSLAGAAWAAGFEPAATLEVLRRTFPRPGRGYTLPLVSIFSPRIGEDSLERAFGETRIEDLWLGYACVAANITRPDIRVFRHGPLRRAVRASGSFPGLLPPVPEAGELLVDGGLMTNLPIEVAQEACPGPIVACDVSREQVMPVDPGLERAPTPLQVLRGRLGPRRGRVRFPGVAAVLLRSVEARETAQRSERRRLATLLLTPPLDGYRLLDTDRVEEILEAGYRYAQEALRELPPELAAAMGAAPRAR